MTFARLRARPLPAPDLLRSWLWLVDFDRASDTVGFLLRHVRGRVRCVGARPVRGVNRPFEGVTERRCLALLDAFEDDLVRLHDVIDVESQVPYSGMADQFPVQLRGEGTRPAPAWAARQLNTDT